MSLTFKPAEAFLQDSPAQLPRPHLEEMADLLPSSFPELTPAKLHISDPKPRLLSRNMTQQQKQRVTKRLSCLDPGWLERCQEGELQPGKEWLRNGCPVPTDAADSSQRPPGCRSLENGGLSDTGERRGEMCSDSLRGNCQGSTLGKNPLVHSAEDKCRLSVQDNFAAGKTSPEGAVMVANAVSSVVKDVHKLETCQKAAAQKTEKPLLPQTSPRMGVAWGVLEAGSSPAKREKSTCRKKRQDAAAPADDGTACPSGKKRKRTKGVVGSSCVKKPRAVSQEPEGSEYDFDGQVQVEGGASASVSLDENLLGEVREEGCLQRGARGTIPACRCVQGGKCPPAFVQLAAALLGVLFWGVGRSGSFRAPLHTSCVGFWLISKRTVPSYPNARPAIQRGWCSLCFSQSTSGGHWRSPRVKVPLPCVEPQPLLGVCSSPCSQNS